MKDILVVKNPFPTTSCEMRKCLLCKNVSSVSNQIKFPCNSNNVGYKLVCETCQDRGLDKVYEGETARSARVRGAEHRRNCINGREDSALHKHKLNAHKDEEMKFRMEITNKFRDPLTRQANEAIRISSRKKNEILNSKNEFNHPPITRITVERTKRLKPKVLPSPVQPSL